MPSAEPHAGHQMLVNQIHAALDGFPGMAPVEKLALLGQIIGHVIAELPTGAGYSPEQVMHAVSLNIASGNQARARKLADQMAAVTGERLQ